MSDDELIIRASILWRHGKDTREIAQDLRVSEADVWNRIEKIKAKARRG